MLLTDPMKPHRLTPPLLIALLFAAACNSGQTGDAGLRVQTTDDRDLDAPDASANSEHAPKGDDDTGMGAAPDAGADVPPTPDPQTAPTDTVKDPTPDVPTGSDTSLPLPCEVFSDADQACVAAHSTVRQLVEGYTGPLYQLERSDGSTLDIGSIDGHADVASHDEFCAGSGCVFSLIYDQSGMDNDLSASPPGSAKPTPGNPANASDLQVLIDGSDAYAVLLRPGMGYRKLVGNGTATADDPQTVYMLTSQHDLINGCCFDYGNGSATANNDGNGTTEALYFGGGVIWGTGDGEGPWVMADLENGLYAGWENGQDGNISSNTPLLHDFVTAVLVGDTAERNAGQGRFALYGGDGTAGELKTMYDGIRPEKPGYVPMQKQGGIILGIASDNSDGDGGRFYEGVMASGAATPATLAALQAAIIEANYGQ